MTAIGQQVRALREKAGLSQAALGAAIGVEQTTISNIETGYSLPSLKVLMSLAKTFGVTLDDLTEATTEAA